MRRAKLDNTLKECEHDKKKREKHHKALVVEMFKAIKFYDPTRIRSLFHKAPNYEERDDEGNTFLSAAV